LALPASSTPADAKPSLPSPAEAADLVRRAEKCFPDPTCTEDADSLYRRADDAGSPDVSCIRFYYGIGVSVDLARARACFDRQSTANPPSKSSSPDLDLLYLAAMLIDGQGGPADPTRATALLGGAFADISVTSLLDEVDKRSKPSTSRAPLDFCKDIGGTTLSIGQCTAVERDRVESERVRVDRLILPKLDAEGQKRAIAAREAWSAFSEKEGDVYGDKYRGGSLSSSANVGHRNALEKARADAMGRFFAYKPASGADPDAAERALDKAYHATCDTDAQRKNLCAAARRAFGTYRSAEIALYTHVHGGALGEREVVRDVKATLAANYQKDLEDVNQP
jgi:hypothetical protein